MTMVTLVQAASPTETLDRFHQALRENNPSDALTHVAPDAVIYEQGFAENTRDEWVRGQLQDAIAFAKLTERTTLRRELHQSHDLAWVLSSTATTGIFDGRPLALEGAETAVLRLESGIWKIVHLHWSAHEQAQAEPPAEGSGLDPGLESRN
ncbi:MAG: nuclear transport factor 2 family protein [Panacagrimonas sp.]